MAVPPSAGPGTRPKSSTNHFSLFGSPSFSRGVFFPDAPQGLSKASLMGRWYRWWAGSTHQEEGRKTTMASNHDSERPEIPLGASGNFQVSPCPRWAQAEHLADEPFCLVAPVPHTLRLAQSRDKGCGVCEGRRKEGSRHR